MFYTISLSLSLSLSSLLSPSLSPSLSFSLSLSLSLSLSFSLSHSLPPLPFPLPPSHSGFREANEDIFQKKKKVLPKNALVVQTFLPARFSMSALHLFLKEEKNKNALL